MPYIKAVTLLCILLWFNPFINENPISHSEHEFPTPSYDIGFLCSVENFTLFKSINWNLKTLHGKIDT